MKGSERVTDIGMLRAHLSSWLTVALDGYRDLPGEGDLVALRDWIDNGLDGPMPWPEGQGE